MGNRHWQRRWTGYPSVLPSPKKRDSLALQTDLVYFKHRQRLLLSFITPYSSQAFAPLGFSSKRSRADLAEFFSSRPLIDRCKNLAAGTKRREISFFLMFSCVTRIERSRFGHAALAEVSGNRFGYRLQHVSSTKQTCFAEACTAAGKLTRPTKSQRLRITFTKTSPQQTDPPTR